MDATLARSQQECLSRFLAAVRDGRGGDYTKAGEIVERVRKAAGDEAADRAKNELWRYMKSGKKA
jgi:uncharacterized protein Yka (UPF0111/DUF47 family)